MTLGSASITHGPGQRFEGAKGRIYTLGSYRCRGGEGFIYDLDRRPGRLAKIYAEEKPVLQREKLETLAAITDTRLRKIAALPEDILIDGAGRLAGFVMPEVRNARPLHELISPVDRLRYFPHLSYKHLVMIAANITRVIAANHAARIVIADVNTRNLLVTPDGIVHLVDCDSVQIGDGRRHRCSVAMEEFLAPELYGARLDQVPRTPAHDTFALAVIVFQLLIAGRHPHTGQQYRGEILDIPAAIRAHRHVLASRRSDTLFPQLGIAPTAVLSQDMIDAFQSAFGWSIRLRRPTADTWLGLLERFHDELQQCSMNGRHQHGQGARACPWCEIEHRHGALFPPAPMRPAATAPATPQRSHRAHLTTALLPVLRHLLRGFRHLATETAPDIAYALIGFIHRRPKMAAAIALSAYLAIKL